MTSIESVDVSDPYLPEHGNPGYAVQHYDLELDYRVATNRLSGRARLTVVTYEALSGLSLDLAKLRVSKGVADTRRVARFSQRAGKLHVSFDVPVPVGSAIVLDIGYGGSPKALDGPWGEVGWEELSDGLIVAGQPDGAPSWFPCNDLPSEKASYRIAVTAESPYTVVANGELVDRRVRASRTTWVYEQPEPMATYLATVQIGRYEWQTFEAVVALHTAAAVAPRHRARLRAAAADAGRVPGHVRALPVRGLHGRRDRRRPRNSP